MKDDPVCPFIDSIRDAIAIGGALAKVKHYDRGWAERVYSGDPKITYLTGPGVLNKELSSMWYDGFLTLDERRAIITEYVRLRLTS